MHAARSGSSDTSSLGASLGVRPSGYSRFGGATADKASGRRVTKTEAAVSRDHKGAKTGGSSGTKFGNASETAPAAPSAGDFSKQPPTRRASVPENDSFKANQPSAKPAAHGKPAGGSEQEWAPSRVNVAECTSAAAASTEDVDMLYASPGVTSQTRRADSNGSADSTARFGFTNTAPPLGVKRGPSAADKISSAVQQQGQAQNGVAKGTASFTFSFESQQSAGAAASSGAAAAAAPSADASATGFASERPGADEPKTSSGQGPRSAQAEPSAVPGVMGKQSQPEEQRKTSKQASKQEAQTSTEAQAPEAAKMSASGFTLGAFSRLHNARKAKAAAAKAKAAPQASREPATAEAAATHEQKLPPSSTGGAEAGVKASNAWRSYAEELLSSKAAAAGAAGDVGDQERAQPSEARQQDAFESFVGCGDTPGSSASGAAPVTAQAKSSHVAGARPVEDSAATQQRAAPEESLASRLWRQRLGDAEPEAASTAESAATSAAAAEMGGGRAAAAHGGTTEGTSPGVGAPGQPGAAPFGGVPAGQPTSGSEQPGGATFGFGQAPKAQQVQPRRGRAQQHSRQARNPASSVPTQPATGPAAATFSFGGQPGQQNAPCAASQQPLFGFQPAAQAAAPQPFGSSAAAASFSWAVPAAPAGAAATGQAGSAAAQPFAFKSPSSKGSAPSGRAAAPAAKPSAFDWGKPLASIPFASPAAASEPAAPAGFRASWFATSSMAPQPATAETGPGPAASAFWHPPKGSAAVSETSRASSSGSEPQQHVGHGHGRLLRIAVSPPRVQEQPLPQPSTSNAGALSSIAGSSCQGC